MSPGVSSRAMHHAASRRFGMPAEHRLDFAELDAEAADLDLVVEPAEAIDVAVGQQPREVAGLVEARAGFSRKRIGDELLRRQFSAGCGSRGPGRRRRCAARRARRSGTGCRLRVEDVEPGVGDGPPDVDRRVVARDLRQR